MSNPIGWCEQTWNPVTGCTKVSPGCLNCYAERMAKRLAGRYGYPADEPFRVTLHDCRLGDPARWHKPRHVFVCSMADLFHKDVPFTFIDRVMAVIEGEEHHTYLLLTKRPERMAEYFARRRDDLEEFNQSYTAFVNGKASACPRNAWLGVTAEDQQQADERIPVLLSIPAAKRFVSVEPMLGSVDFRPYLPQKCIVHHVHNCGCDRPPHLDWVVCGGETGPGARPAHPDWFRSLRDQCQEAGVAFWLKQMSGRAPIPEDLRIKERPNA